MWREANDSQRSWNSKADLHDLRFVSQLRSSFSSFKGAPGDWCFQMFDVKAAKGGALYFQQSFTSWIPQRNTGLQLGDRTMEWAIYGWLLTTPTFRPSYYKQVFYESACCLFPPTFGVSISTPDQGLKKLNSSVDDSFKSHGIYFLPVRSHIWLSKRKTSLEKKHRSLCIWMMNIRLVMTDHLLSLFLLGPYHRSRRISAARTLKNSHDSASISRAQIDLSINTSGSQSSSHQLCHQQSHPMSLAVFFSSVIFRVRFTRVTRGE